MKVAQSCLTLCSPMDYTVNGILQARILEWVAFPFSRGSSQPRDRAQVSRISGRFFTSWATREAQEFTVLMWCIMLTDLQMLNHPWIPGINPTWSWCMILLMYYCIWFINILFCISVHQVYWPIIIFFFLSVFEIIILLWYVGNFGLVKWVWKYSFLLKNLRKMGIKPLGFCRTH